MFIQQFYDSRERLQDVLAKHIALTLSQAISHRGHATFVVSGGTSPVGVFHRLAATPIDWSSVTILPSDERWVPESDAASNAAMIRRELLKDHASKARFFSLYDDNVAFEDAAEVMSDRVVALPTPFDYVLLGMGSDGHTASLFPDAADIDAALSSRKACVLAEPPSQAQSRISLSPQALLNSVAIGILFFGQEKADVFAEASLPGELNEYPVRVVLRQELVPVTSYFAL
ncbi:MAG: 6-phosphogluconolactonase [Pseudomonadota bacterium]